MSYALFFDKNELGVSNDGDSKLLKIIQESAPSFEYCFPGGKDTPLIIACKKDKKLKEIKKLVKDGENVNAQDNNGETPLLWSIRKNNILTAKFLIENGANINLTSIDGWTPLLMACEKSSLNMVNLLVEHGADVNGTSPKKCTPLMCTCIYQTGTEILSYLIEKGADINAEDHMGCPPLYFVCLHGNTKKAECLIAAGAKIDVNCCGMSLIDATMVYGRNDVHQVLLKHGAKESKSVPHVDKIAVF